MNPLTQLKDISEYILEIPQSTHSDMKVPARIFMSRAMLDQLGNDRSIEQLINVATLPGIEPYALAMPDMHQGYGFPIGGIAAFRASDGVISPGGVGYDINCGVRLLTSTVTATEIGKFIEKLANQIQHEVPSGVGVGGIFAQGEAEMIQVLNTGSQWALKKGFALDDDLLATEANGWINNADASLVSERAKRRGYDQLGTIGSGNHFVEIQQVIEVFNMETARIFNLFEGQVVIMIHTGSRGLGHQVCSDYVNTIYESIDRYQIDVPDKELSCVPFQSQEGQNYFAAMGAAANFAFANRQIITYQIRKAWEHVIGCRFDSSLQLLYDVAHNMAKLEEHHAKKLVVHRKGATRAFGPGSQDLPLRYRETGQPVLIPGSMGTFSYVLSGNAAAMNQTFGSCCHGAGRQLSRTKAKASIDYNKLVRELKNQGVTIRAGSSKGLLEEAPQAYKDISQVIQVVSSSGLANVVAKLRPLAVIKG